MSEPGKLDLEIVRRLEAPRAKVWKAWTDPNILKEWWCPKPWTTEVKAFDLRAGGAFHTYMTGPEGGESDNPGVFLEVLTMEKIVWTSMLTAGWRPGKPWLPMTGIFLFEDDGGATRFTARCLHGDEASCAKHAEMGFYEGWGTMVDQLGETSKGL